MSPPSGDARQEGSGVVGSPPESWRARCSKTDRDGGVEAPDVRLLSLVRAGGRFFMVRHGYAAMGHTAERGDPARTAAAQRFYFAMAYFLLLSFLFLIFSFITL
jgi:hypothetical protein